MQNSPTPFWGQVIFAFGIIVFAFTFVITKPKHQLNFAYYIAILGAVSCPFWIILDLAPSGSMLFLLAWSFMMVLAERREYFNFRHTVIFMVFLIVLLAIGLLSATPNDIISNITSIGGGVFTISVTLYLLYIDFDAEQNFYENSRQIENDMVLLSQKMSDILTGKGDLQNILWQVTMECAPLLNLEDCVIYLFDEDKNKLVQVAAFGTSKQFDQTVLSQIDIEPGQGVVGKCFETRTPQLVQETQFFDGYIVDDKIRKSELAVPIISNGKVRGVLDSEHTMKGFFKERHTKAFQIIASFCGMKITETEAFESIKKVQIAEAEVGKYKELDELKNRFITNISHDLKTPLSLIKAPAMQIAELTENKKVKVHSNYILKNTDHLLRVVNQLLQLNRVDKGLNELYLEEVDIESLVEKVKTQYLGLAESQQVDFRTSVEPTRLLTDVFRLEQIMHNLVHNAFRYTGRNGKVELESKREDDVLKISICDNGPGISREMQDKVFERFFKADVNNHEGTGIGLSLVQEYTQSLQGSVDLESEEGQGTTFTVSIPLKPVSDKNQKISSAEMMLVEDDKPILLVVEDHADLNDFICTYFEDDFHCISAFDGEQGIEKLKKTTPDIVISDLMMPKMNGLDFISFIKSSDSYGHIPVVVLSAKSQTESKIDLYKSGADNYLVKPFDIHELGAVVESILEQRKKIKFLFRQKFLNVAKPQFKEDEVSTETIEDSLLSRAVDFVKTNLDDSTLSVKSMCESLGYGRNRLQKEIKELTGLTPVEFVRTVRLDEAKKMLQQPNLNISEVAYSVGFNNLSYFTRSFKIEFDTLPSEWQDGFR